MENSEKDFQAEGEPSENVMEFRYLGLVMYR